MKYIAVYEVVSIAFLAITLYLVNGGIGQKEAEVLIMYGLFMIGSFGYLGPAYIYSKRVNKQNHTRRKMDKVV